MKGVTPIREMSSLTHQDVQALSLFLQQIHAEYDVKTFGKRILSLIPQLVASELTLFGSISHQKREVAFISSCPSFSLNSEHVHQGFYEHPCLAYQAKTGNCRTYKISDFMNEREFDRSEAMSQQFLGPLGLKDQMLVVLPHQQYSPTSSEGAWQGEDTMMVSLKRSDRSFLERDRTILNLLRPHLMQAHHNATKFSRMQQSLVEQNQALEQSNTLILNQAGQVKLLTRQACNLLNYYFHPSSKSSQLPDTLQRWVAHQILRFRSSEAIAFTPLSLRVQQSEKCLVVRLIPNLANGEFLLLLEEQQVRSFSPIELELLGLTKREAEVLFWVAKDKTNPEIAKLLSCSVSTVKTHLEHIYEKLGVQTRMAAVMYAIEHLGLLNRTDTASSLPN